MNILWSIHLYYPNHCCGSESMAHHINKYLISKGHHVRVILHQDKGIFTPYDYEGVEVFGSMVGQKVDTYRWADIICTHLDFTQFTIIMAKQAERPLVHFVHNDIPYSSITNNFGNVSAVYNTDWIAKGLNYPIPGYTLHPPCEGYKVDNSGADAVTLISLNYMKGGYLLAQLAHEMPERRFIGVVGSYDNPGNSKINQDMIVGMLRDYPNVEIVANSPDIKSTYKRTRILIMPSYYESFGRTATEAMSSGIPVICTPTPGLVENCGKAAIYVGKRIENSKPGDDQVTIGTVDEWKKAIELLDDEKYYAKKSLLCTDRAGELDPLKELEGLEQFFYSIK